jgi:hypothetical protein
MAARRSAITIKAEMAAKRERVIATRLPRDDGFLRRTDREPISCEEQREKSRGRKVWVSAYDRYKHELFKRKMMGAERAALREEFIPLTMYAPGTANFVGKYQEVDK